MDAMIAAGYIITILLIVLNTILVLKSDINIDEEAPPANRDGH